MIRKVLMRIASFWMDTDWLRQMWNAEEEARASELRVKSRAEGIANRIRVEEWT